MSKLVFNPEDHTYKIGNISVPGFSEVINLISIKKCYKCDGKGCDYCGNTGRVNWYTDESSERGIWIHLAIMMSLKGELDVEYELERHPEEMKSVLSFLRFIEKQGLKEAAEEGLFICEHPLYSDEINTGGTFDVIFPTKAKLIEIKTGKKKTGDVFQIAIYKHLVEHNIKKGWLNEYKIPPGDWQCFLVYLNEDSYKAEEHPDLLLQYKLIFQSFRVTWEWWMKP